MAPRALLIVVLILLSVSLVEAREAVPGHAVPFTGKVTAIAPEASAKVTPILPLPVRASKDTTLKVMGATNASTKNVLVRERAAYSAIHAQWVNASSAERTTLQPEIVEQRQRVLMATLNGVTAIYQRMDVILTKFDATLIRLRSIHSNRVTPVPDFESRYAALKTELDSLHTQSSQVATEITACQGGVDLSACVQSSRAQSSDLLISLRKFFTSYRALAVEVIH